MTADSTRTCHEGVAFGVKRALPRRLDLVVSRAKRSTIALRATVFQRPSRLRVAPGLSERSVKSHRWIWLARARTAKYQSPGCVSGAAGAPAAPLFAVPPYREDPPAPESLPRATRKRSASA